MDTETIEDAREYSRNIINKVYETRELLFSRDAQNDLEFSKFRSVVKYKILSFVCIPLNYRGKILGSIYMDTRSALHTFSKKDVDFLISFANLAGVALSNSLLQKKLTEENVALKQEVKSHYGFESIIAESHSMKKILYLLNKVLDTDISILFLGETGTGKSLLARAMHYHSSRAEARFVEVDCGALPETLIESELFGYVKGAFTGAAADKKGLFEEADNGTLFLDEIDHLSPYLQVKLLRAIQQGEIRRIGDTKNIRVNFRLISASNRNLEQAIKNSEFREDLYFRINTLTLNIPALRERREDIPVLASYFLQKYSKKMKCSISGFSSDAIGLLLGHNWKGNIRELEHAIEGALVLCESARIEKDDLLRFITPEYREEELSSLNLEILEKRAIQKALESSGGIQARSAVLLGITERNLRYKLKKFGLKTSGKRGRPPKNFKNSLFI
jgi:Nif-specific regulatory protein